MYFVVSAGGTAGHINPAIAVACELRSRGHEILFVGTPERIESRLAVEEGFDFVGLEVKGFNKSKPWTLISSGMKILAATKRARAMFEKRRPDAVLTFGAYVSIPVGRAAAAMGIPLIVHEQNSVPGMANRYLAKKADVMALTYGASAASLESRHEPLVVGNPVRSSVELASRSHGRELFDIPEDALMLLVFGGSLGARHLNDAIVDMSERLMSIPKLHVVQSTGESDFERVKERLDLSQGQAERWHLMPYISEMGDTLAASNLVVSRAGASSLAEMMTIQVPAVLVPYPYARGDHQTLNAQSCVEAGASKLVPDDRLDGAEFSDLLMELLADGSARATMAAACAGLSGSQARVKLATLAEEAADK